MESALAPVDKLDPDAVMRILEEEAANLTPNARRYCLDNLQRSGINLDRPRKPGENKLPRLREMVANVTCRVRKYYRHGSSGPSAIALAIEMPGNHVRDAYRKAMALSFGSVYAPHVVREITDLSTGAKRMAKASPYGGKLKRTLKSQYLYGKAPSVRERAYQLEHGVKQVGFSRHTKGSVSVDLGGNKTRIVRARPYWYLSDRQVGALAQELVDRAQQRIDVLLAEQKARA